MWMAVAQAGLSTAGSFMSYKAEKAQYKAKKQWQEYNNKMLRIVDASNQNAITTNTINMQQSATLQAINNQRSSILAAGAAAVSAGAAGVEGNSVNMTMFDIQRNGAVAEYTRALGVSQAHDQFAQQRLQSATSAHMQQDFSYIPKPSLASAVLGGLAGGATAFDNQQRQSGGRTIAQMLQF